MDELTRVRFTCEACGTAYAVRPELAGRLIRCRCGRTTRAPETLTIMPQSPPKKRRRRRSTRPPEGSTGPTWSDVLE